MIKLNTPAPTAHAGILGLGVFRPERVVTNDEICLRIDSNDEWIQERSGIIERRNAGSDETVVTMATAAARKAIADAGITAEQLDLVMVATVTHRYQTPSAAVEVAAAIGAINAAATVTSAACAGAATAWLQLSAFAPTITAAPRTKPMPKLRYRSEENSRMGRSR
jgi:3-oxoacyl-[acyl-carrier-protein] synthase-3